MSGDAVGLVRQRDAAFLLQHAQHRDGVGHDRRLGVFGEGKLVLRPLAHQREQLLAERIVDFFEHRARGGTGIGEVRTHADLLAALPREYKRAHLQHLLAARL